jgi:hypothetical protein
MACDFIHPNWGSCVASGANHEMHQFNIFENNRLVDQKFCHNDDWHPPEHKTKEAMATDLVSKTRATREFQKQQDAQPPPDGDRDGETYERQFDYERLNAQAQRVYRVMADGEWHTLADLSAATNDPEASISARLRDFRKEEFGGREVERRRVAGGLFEYRLADAALQSAAPGLRNFD